MSEERDTSIASIKDIFAANGPIPVCEIISVEYSDFFYTPHEVFVDVDVLLWSSGKLHFFIHFVHSANTDY